MIRREYGSLYYQECKESSNCVLAVCQIDINFNEQKLFLRVTTSHYSGLPQSFQLLDGPLECAWISTQTTQTI